MRNLLYIVFFISFCTSHLIAQSHTSDEKDFYQTAEGLVTELYGLVSFEAGELPDWIKVKSMFIDDAIIVLRTNRDSTTIFSVNGFVNDFIKFSEYPKVQHNGFVEKIISMKTLIFGDMANILVLYEASIPETQRPPQKGVDNFSLIKKGNRLWIISITNDIPTPNNPIPKELLN